ncbi:MAG TPA: hypothetical protein PLX35_12900 [Cyclobacteriaceae bacterium]|nr:hypothetical protein [Cyclobacteriaceae bacterium]
MNSIDELFRNKLSQHAVEPSASAWSAIEKQLDGQRKPVVLWRWAAVLLLGGLLIGFYLSLRLQPEPVLTESIPVTPSPRDVVKQEAVTQTTTVTPAVTRKPSTIKATPVVVPPTIAETTVAREELPIEKVVMTETEVVTEPVVAASQTTTGIVLTYTLETIPATAPVTAVTAEVTPEEKPAGTLLAKARRGELPIGDFRQLKDNLFALDIHRKTTTKQQ